LERAAQRLALRTHRPTQERVNDEVHKALVGEIQHITGVTASLKIKIASVDRKIRRLELQRDLLLDNVKDKERSWKVDEDCVMMDGRAALSRPPVSVCSSAGSVRSVGSRFSNLSGSSCRFASPYMEVCDFLKV